MSMIQKLFTRLLPFSWAQSMEAESREWKVRCNCGHQRSIWELGGIRWKATGNPRSLMKCRACGKTGWHKVVRDPSAK